MVALYRPLWGDAGLTEWTGTMRRHLRNIRVSGQRNGCRHSPIADLIRLA